MERIGRADHEHQHRQHDAAQAQGAVKKHHDPQGPNQAHDHSQSREQHPAQRAETEKQHSHDEEQRQRQQVDQVLSHGLGRVRLKVRQAGVVDLFGPLLSVYDRLDLVVDATADELVFANALEKGEREGSRPAVRRYVVFEVNRSVGYFLLQCLPGFRRRWDVRNEQILLVPPHLGNNVWRVGEADHALHLGDFSELLGEAFDLLQHLRRVDVVGDETDHRHIIAAKEPTDLIIVVLFWVTLRQDAFG